MTNFQAAGLVFAFAALAMSFSGCQTFPNGNQNATLGGVLGGTTGGLMGAALGAPEGKSGEGAMVGALAGATAGSIIGNQADRSIEYERQYLLEQTQAKRANALSFPQIVELTRSGLSEEVIINQINALGILAPPSTNDLISLKNGGVTDRVIAHIQSRQSRPAARLPQQPFEYVPAPSGVFVFEKGRTYCPPPIPPRFRHRHWH